MLMSQWTSINEQFYYIYYDLCECCMCFCIRTNWRYDSTCYVREKIMINPTTTTKTKHHTFTYMHACIHIILSNKKRQSHTHVFVRTDALSYSDWFQANPCQSNETEWNERQNFGIFSFCLCLANCKLDLWKHLIIIYRCCATPMCTSISKHSQWCIKYLSLFVWKFPILVNHSIKFHAMHESLGFNTRSSV